MSTENVVAWSIPKPRDCRMDFSLIRTATYSRPLFDRPTLAPEDVRRIAEKHAAHLREACAVEYIRAAIIEALGGKNG